MAKLFEEKNRKSKRKKIIKETKNQSGQIEEFSVIIKSKVRRNNAGTCRQYVHFKHDAFRIFNSFIHVSLIVLLFTNSV